MEEEQIEAFDLKNSSRDCFTATQTASHPCQTPTPFGLLQNSPNFALESYTLKDPLNYRNLQTFNAIEEHSNNFFRVNTYYGFFARGSRQWCRLFLSVVISQSPPYWNYFRVSTVKVYPERLPESLRKGVEIFFSMVENFQDVWHLIVQLEGNTTLGYDACPQSQIRPKQIRSPPCFQDILSRLDDLGCPRYCEDHLVRLTGVGRFGRCAIYADRRLLLEFRFTTLLPTGRRDLQH